MLIDDLERQIKKDQSNLTETDIEKAIELIEIAKRIEDEELRNSLLSIGINLLGEKNEDMIIGIADSDDMYLNEEIAITLSHIGTPKSLDVLEKLKKTHPQVETEAVRAIEKIKLRFA